MYFRCFQHVCGCCCSRNGKTFAKFQPTITHFTFVCKVHSCPAYSKIYQALQEKMPATYLMVSKLQVIGISRELFWKSYDSTFRSLDGIFNGNLQLDAVKCLEQKWKYWKFNCQTKVVSNGNCPCQLQCHQFLRVLKGELACNELQLHRPLVS